MRERIQHFRDMVRLIGCRPFLIALLVLFLTAGIATYAGVRIHSTEKKVLRQQGELYAKEAAIEYNRFLLTHADIVTLVGYTVDELIASGADNQVILKYITDETKTVIAILDPSTTGLYGWIQGEYLDGAGWVPDADYVATERPWYTETLASDRSITFVDPYLDVHTGTVMMTVTALLHDGESVIAMDVTLATIQQIIQQASSSTEGSRAFLLDSNGVVIAHSDESQLGRNYLEETDSVGALAARQLLVQGEMQFDLDTDEGSYSVYVDDLEGSWYSVSLINADIWYRPLRRAMILFFIILSLVVIFIISAIFRLIAHNLALQELYNRIAQEEQRGNRLLALSETDRMTGLFNRVSGESKIRELLSAQGCGMFLELDIDHFKSINDTFGHQTGDAVIRALAEALQSTFRANDITIRLGGDEFGVFAVGIADETLGANIVRRLFNRLENLDLPELRGGKFTISVGAVLCAKDDSRTFEAIYASADGAMYASKKQTGNYLTFHTQ